MTRLKTEAGHRFKLANLANGRTIVVEGGARGHVLGLLFARRGGRA